jgi:hypothetical protein
MKRVAVLLVSFAAAACAPMDWTRTDATPDQKEADLQSCRQLASHEATFPAFGYYGYYGGAGPLAWYDPYGFRMYPWPYYSPLADPYGERFLEEKRLTDFCMRSRGYELAQVKK